MSCADIRDEGYVYNPPSEDKGLVLRVALGCSHNACTFCGMYRNVGFRIRDFAEILPEIRETKENKPNLKRVFLGDGNALAAPTEQLLPILQRLKATFPMLATISCAARADDLLAKSVAELSELREAGLSLVYLGVENIHLGPTLPGFLSPNVAKVLVETFGIAGIGTVDEDIKLFMGA